MNEEEYRFSDPDEWERVLGDVEEGEEVYITRGDEVVAVLISIDRLDQLLADLERLLPTEWRQNRTRRCN